MANVKRKSNITPSQVIAARGYRTQNQVAKFLGVSVRQVRNYESGVTAIRERDYVALAESRPD